MNIIKVNNKAIAKYIYIKIKEPRCPMTRPNSNINNDKIKGKKIKLRYIQLKIF